MDVTLYAVFIGRSYVYQIVHEKRDEHVLVVQEYCYVLYYSYKSGLDL